MALVHRRGALGKRAAKRCGALLAVVLVLVGALSALPQPVEAWKPVTHVHLSEVARLDAIDDGRVAIYAVDYETGVIGDKLGDFAVDADILKALRACPAQYRAGAYGADFVPDIFISQALIHPDNRSWGNTRSDQWLQRIWSAGSASPLPPTLTPPECTAALARKAFAVGVLTHAAGDLFGHSYVNEFAGGAWEYNRIAARHMIFEAYIDKRTPDDSPGFYDVSIAGVEGMIYEAMLRGNNPSGVASLTSIARPADLTLSRLFGGVRAMLVTRINAYALALADYDARYLAKTSEAAACKWYDMTCSATALYAEATAILAQKAAYISSRGPLIAYLRAWRDDIDQGLAAWPASSFPAHRSAFYRQPQTYYPSPDTYLEEWASDHLLSMMGMPDVLAAAITYDIIEAMLPSWVKDEFEDMRAGLYNWLLRSALGDQIAEWAHYINNPELYFDDVPTLFANDGCWMSLADMNAGELGLSDDGFGDPDETYDWREFRPAYNTVTMIKLSFLSRDGLRALLRTLDSNLNANSVQMPIILGFMNSLDESSQGIAPLNPADGTMFLARDLATYRQLFVRQRGIRLDDEDEGVDCATRYGGEDTTSGDAQDSDGSDGEEDDDGGPGADLFAGAFRSNGSRIAGWYWLRDAGLSHYAEWEFQDVQALGGDLVLDITALATNRSGGGRGFGAVFRLVYGYPGAGQAGGALHSTIVTLPNVSPPSDPVGYTCNGTVVIPGAALQGGSHLFVRVERLSPTDHHVAFRQDSIVVRTGMQ